MQVGFISHLARCEQRIDAASHDAAEAGALKLIELTVRNLKSGTRTGEWYRIPGTKRKRSKKDRRRGLPSEGPGRAGGRHKWYRASAPGEYPAVRLGQLSGPRGLIISMGVGFESHVAYVRTPLAYARELEDKKTPKGRRPFLSRTYNENSSDIQRVVDRVFAKL